MPGHDDPVSRERLPALVVGDERGEPVGRHGAAEHAALGVEDLHDLGRGHGDRVGEASGIDEGGDRPGAREGVGLDRAAE